jgi:hypothetical protein
VPGSDQPDAASAEVASTEAASAEAASAEVASADAATSSPPVDSAPDRSSNVLSQVIVPNGIAVVNSDHQSTSISFLDRNGNLLQDGCFGGAGNTPGLNAPLSGDVVLPTQVPTGGPVAIIDRGNQTLTWLDPETCAPIGQLAVDTGFASDPHDAVAVSAGKAYVTRHAENPSPAAGDFSEGDDLLIIDPTQSKILGRIDLKPYAPAGVLPGADRAVLAEGRVYVSLNAVSADQLTFGTGRLVIVDPVADQVVSTIDLPGAKYCGAIAYLAPDRKLMIACGGAPVDGPKQSDSSAIVVIDLSVSPPAAIVRIAAGTVGGLPFSNTSLAAWDARTAIGVTLGNPSALPPDRLWSLPFDGVLPFKMFESAETSALGAVLVDADSGHVLVADGTTTKPASLRVFELAPGTIATSNVVSTNPSQGLPPRALAWY